MSDLPLPKRHTHCYTPNEALEDVQEGVSAVFDSMIAESEARGEMSARIEWLRRLQSEVSDMLWREGQ